MSDFDQNPGQKTDQVLGNNSSGIKENQGDIGEITVIDKKLRDFHKLLLSIIDNTTDAVFVKDIEGRYVFVNKVAIQVMGRKIHDIIGKTDTEIFSSQTSAEIMEQDMAIRECKKTNTFEVKIDTALLGQRIFIATKGPVCDDGGDLIGTFGISRDITDNKNSEIEVKRLNKTLKMITECNKVMLHTKNEKELLDSICSIIIEHGGYYMTWIGYTGENLGKTIKPIARAGFDDGYLDSVNISRDSNIPEGRGPTGKAIREKCPIYVRDMLVDPEFLPWKEKAIKRGYRSSIALPLLDKNDIIGILCIYSKEQDMFNEEEVKLLTDLSINISHCIMYIRLEEEKTKTQELLKESEEQLRIRQRMDSLGVLASGIGHDFNNLLTSIMGYLDLVYRDKELSEKNKGFIKNTLISSRKAAELVRALQSLSENVVSEIKNVDLYDITNEVFLFLESTTDKIIEKRINFKKGEYFVLGNMQKLNQALLNLGTNSYTAIKEKGLEYGDYISISANEYEAIKNDKTGLPEGEYIHILFEDSGAGMSEENLNKAFDPMFTTKEKNSERGQGLGLTMVYNIVTKIHKGFVNIESFKGVGTTVHIYLPKAKEMENVIKENITIPKNGKQTILVVEDEEMIRNFVCTVLEMKGYNVISAGDGQAGLEAYMENMDKVDLIILDLTMPKMTGQQVFEKILAVKDDIKVIISSGQSNEAIREGVLSKAKGYVSKPYIIDTLTGTIETVLKDS